MNRHELRECVFKEVFQIPFYPEGVPEMESSDEIKADEEDIAFINSRVRDIESHIEDIDSMIESHSNGWKLGRIGKAELAILRVAVYEILFDVDIPDRVAIDEAIELSKTYSDPKSSPFVNGILDSVLRDKK